jgi:hypothetical protein
MIGYFGDYNAGDVVQIPWNTNAADGSSITRAANGSVRIFKDDSNVQRTSGNGITDNEDFDTITGTHLMNIDLSDNTDAGFYAAGHNYHVMVTGQTIDGLSVNVFIGSFSIENRYVGAGGSAPTTAQIATAVWQDLLASSDFSTALSIGKLIKDNLDATISSRATTAGVAALLPANFSALSIDADGRVKALVGLTQNKAFADFQFFMADEAGDPVTGLVDGDFSLKKYSLGGGANGDLSGTITEVDATDAPGFYKISLTSGQTNARNIAYTFLATGTRRTMISVFPSQ